jgi:hypothetical protein
MKGTDWGAGRVRVSSSAKRGCAGNNGANQKKKGKGPARVFDKLFEGEGHIWTPKGYQNVPKSSSDQLGSAKTDA